MSRPVHKIDYPCGGCKRKFATPEGLKNHQRVKACIWKIESPYEGEKELRAYNHMKTNPNQT